MEEVTTTALPLDIGRIWPHCPECHQDCLRGDKPCDECVGDN